MRVSQTGKICLLGLFFVFVWVGGGESSGVGDCWIITGNTVVDEVFLNGILLKGMAYF